MRPGTPRKTAPAVRHGTVQQKNRREPTPNYWNTTQAGLVIDRERPGRGYQHLLRASDVERFLALLPVWEELAEGLDAIVLAAGREYSDGWCHPLGVIAIRAWTKEVPQRWHPGHARDHAQVLDQLGVPRERRGNMVWCGFTEDTARAYQLVHVLLHELGHHHDRMTTRSRSTIARGESFAEAYALRHGAEVWARYVRAFGL